MFLVERNRLLLVLTLYELRTLVLLTPALVALEVAVLALAVRQGWWRQKLAGWRWIVRHGRWCSVAVDQFKVGAWFLTASSPTASPLGSTPATSRSQVRCCH